MDFLKKVNRTPVTSDLLADALELHASMVPEDRDVYEARMFKLFQYLDDKGLQKKRGELAMAIDFRLTALARLQSDQALRGWTLPGTEAGMDYIHADLLKAAADEPVIEDEQKQAAFDVESFRRRVLGIAETRGQA